MFSASYNDKINAYDYLRYPRIRTTGDRTFCDRLFRDTVERRLCLLAGVKAKLNDLSEKVQVHVLTSDTFGRARKELEGINCTVHILEGADHTGGRRRDMSCLWGLERLLESKRKQ